MIRKYSLNITALLLALVALVLSILCNVAHSQEQEFAGSYIDGEQLLEYCQSTNDMDVGSVFCSGYVAGVHDSVDLFALAVRVGSPWVNNICLDESMSLGELRDMVTKYAANNPAATEFDGTNMVLQAFIANSFCHDQ